jgi:osmotically-inducible protein OsmY
MFPIQIHGMVPDEVSRCEERGQVMTHGKELSPVERTDSALQESISQAFWKDAVLRAVEYQEIDVRVKDAVVYLNGHIVSSTSQNRVKKSLSAIPGIVEIKNNLVLDDQLTVEIASALGPLEHTYDCKFFTGTSHGVVSLNGVVSSDKVRLLAEKVIASHPHVRGVINNVRTSGSKLKLQAQPFLQPTIGEVIYFLDGISGVVKQVIINPNNRRVIAMTIQGKFTDPRYAISPSAYGSYGKAHLPEQLVTVSIKAVRYLTRVSGFLYIQSSERTRYLDFDPGIFVAPAHDWQPPYPYCPEDVLFPIEYHNAGIQIEDDPEQLPFGAVVEDSSVREQFFATDSLGL